MTRRRLWYRVVRLQDMGQATRAVTAVIVKHQRPGGLLNPV